MIFLTQADFSVLYVILLSWAGILLLFAIASLIIKVKGDRIKKKLHKEGGYVFFPNVDIQRTARSFLGPNFSLSSKCEVAVGHKEIWFLPGKYSITFFSNPIPNSVDLTSERVSCSSEFQKSMIIRFTAKDLKSAWKLRWGLKINYEVSLTFKDSAIRDEVIRELENRKPTSEI